jgi:hypothetical protein
MPGLFHLRQNRFVTAFIFATIFIVFETQSNADDGFTLKEPISPTVVIDLLSQTTQLSVSETLDDKVKKWRRTKLQVAFRSKGSTQAIESAFSDFADRFRKRMVPLELEEASDIDHADIIVFFDVNSSDVLTKYGFKVSDLLTTSQTELDEQAVSTITQLLNNNTSSCLGFDATIGQYEKNKGLIFVGSGGPTQEIKRCLSSMLASSLGLTNKRVSGDTIKNGLGSPVSLSENDLAALTILYRSSVMPGDNISKVLSSQNLIHFDPAL